MKAFFLSTLQTRFTPGPAQFSEYPSVLFGPLSSQYNQSYYQLVIYAFLALALCGVLAGLAYLFSISTAQETEKRSEYECGFAPFDSATRLPFDVHFYLVGILFLIFDVEVALLFPWVLSLRTVGWFGFYLMFAFLFILTLGFLYEWKRGALIWPSRSHVKAGAFGAAVSSFASETRDIFVGALREFLNDVYAALSLLSYVFTETGHVIFIISVLYAAAYTYEKVVHIELPQALADLDEDNNYVRAVLSGEIPAETSGNSEQEDLPVIVAPEAFTSTFLKEHKGLSRFYALVSVIFVYTIFVSAYLSVALLAIFVSAYLVERNPFFPIKTFRGLVKATVLFPRLALAPVFAFTTFWVFTFYNWTKAKYLGASYEYYVLLHERPPAKIGLTTRLDDTVHIGTWDLLREDVSAKFQKTPHVLLRWLGKKKDVINSREFVTEYEVSLDYRPEPRWIYGYRPRFMFTDYLYAHPNLKAVYSYIDDTVATFSWASVTAAVTFAAVLLSFFVAYYLGHISAQIPKRANTWFTWRRGFFASYYQTLYQLVKLSWIALAAGVAGYMAFHMDLYPQEKAVLAMFEYPQIMQKRIFVFFYKIQMLVPMGQQFIYVQLPAFFTIYLPEFFNVTLPTFFTITVPEFFTITLLSFFTSTLPEFFTVTLPPVLSSNFVLAVEYFIYFLPRMVFDVLFEAFLLLLVTSLWLFTLVTVTIPGWISFAVKSLVSFITYVGGGIWWVWVKAEHEISWHYRKHVPSWAKSILSDAYSHPIWYAYSAFIIYRSAQLMWTHSGPLFAPRFTATELLLALLVFPFFDVYLHFAIRGYVSLRFAYWVFGIRNKKPTSSTTSGPTRSTLLVAISDMDPEVRDALYIWISHNGYMNALQIIGPYAIYCTLALFVVTAMFADVTLLLVKGHFVSYKHVDFTRVGMYAKNSPFPLYLRKQLFNKKIFYWWVRFTPLLPGFFIGLHWCYIYLPPLKEVIPFTYEEFPKLGVDITHEMDKYHWKAPYFYYHGTVILLFSITLLVLLSISLSRDIQLFATEPAALADEKRMRDLRRTLAPVIDEEILELRAYRAFVEEVVPEVNQTEIDAKLQVELNEKNEAADAVWTSKMNEKDSTPFDQKTLDEKLATHSVIYKHVFTKNETPSDPSAQSSKSVLFFASLLVSPIDQLQAEFYPAVAILSNVPMLVEGFLFTLICYVLVSLSMDLGEDHQKRELTKKSWKTLCAGLLVLCAALAFQLVYPAETSPILGGYFATSPVITLFKLITLLSVLFVLDASSTFMAGHRRHLLEYPLMLSLTTLFMLLLISANHIMSAFLSLVGFSLGLYVLVLYDANKKPARESGVKYYYLSALSSGLILYGLLVTYALVGTGNFDEMFFTLDAKTHLHSSRLLQMATLFVLVGFFFKLSAFPGHLWAADVYEGSPAPVTAFFMLPVKIAVLGAFVRMFSVALSSLAPFWLPVLTVAVIVSILWGAFASVQEKKIRRFLAYASINQMGFLLMGLTTDSDEGFQAALVYIGVYALMTCAFLTVFLSARRQDGAELLYISDFRTLARENWVVGWSLGVILFSMAGIPPLGGFFAKYFVLLHAFEKGLILEVVVGLATSLISTYYYLRIIKTISFEQPEGALHVYSGVSGWKFTQLAAFEGALWGFVIASPYVLQYTYSLAVTHGPVLA